MLALKNIKEMHIAPAVAQPYTIAAAGHVWRFQAPFNGRVRRLLINPVVQAGAGGSSHVQGIEMRDTGNDGAGTTALTAQALSKNGATRPAVGTEIIALGNGVTFTRGTLLSFYAIETGTPGGTDSQVSMFVELEKTGRANPDP